MFGLTTRRRLAEEADAHLNTIRRMITAETARDTARQALRDEIDAHITTIRTRHNAEDDRDRANQHLRDEIEAHMSAVRALCTTEDNLAAERRTSKLLAEQLLATATPRPIEHPDELWSLIDWSLWGSGMGDTFRERLADAFLQAITPEDHETALRLIQAWTDSGRTPLGRRRYEDLNRRLDRALANVVRWRKAAAEQRTATAGPTDA